MPTLWGLGLAIGTAAFAATSGLDRSRAFYPTVTVVVASYYVLFAVLDGGTGVLMLEIALFGLFAFAAVLGFKRTPWILVGALGSHGILDTVHHRLIANYGVPAWWPTFCFVFDVLLGAYLACRLWRLSSSGTIPFEGGPLTDAHAPGSMRR